MELEAELFHTSSFVRHWECAAIPRFDLLSTGCGAEGRLRMQLSDPPNFLTVSDFLKRYSISRTHFYREVNREAIPIIKIGRLTRIRIEDAEAWADALPVKGGKHAA